MFRDNEAGLVGEVRARAQERDAAAVAAAAVQLWLTAPERPEDPDAAAREVWQAVTAADARAAACTAALPLVRDGRAIRPHAFIDIVEHLGATEPDRLLEVLDDVLGHVVARRLPASPYLAATALALVDAGREAPLWTALQRQRDGVRADPDAWLLVSTLLTTTKIGARADLLAWFEDLEARAQRGEVPAWIVDAFARTELAVGTTVAQVARRLGATWPHLRRDVTAGTAAALYLLDLAAAGDLDAWLAAFDTHRAALVGAPVTTDHPLIRYYNAHKHARPVDIVDAMFAHAEFEVKPFRGSVIGSLVAVAASQQGERPPYWRIGVLLNDAPSCATAAGDLMPVLADLARATPRTPEVIELHRRRARAQPARLPSLVPLWDRTFRARSSWWQRFKLAFA